MPTPLFLIVFHLWNLCLITDEIECTLRDEKGFYKSRLKMSGKTLSR